MRDYSGRTGPRPPSPEGAPPPTRPTRSVRVAVGLTWSVAALFAIAAALTFLYLDRIGALAGVGSSVVQQRAAREDAALTALFRLAVFGGAWALLGWFLLRGHHAARVMLTVLAIIGLVSGVPALVPAQPLPLLVTDLAQLVLQATLLFFLYRPDANDYLRPRPRRRR